MRRILLLGAVLVSCASPSRDAPPVGVARGAVVRSARPLLEARGRFACVPLGGGVLAIGSDAPSGSYLSTSEAFDAATGTWMPSGKLVAGRWGHSATLLADGRVLVAGGFEDDKMPPIIGSVEIFDKGAFTATAPLIEARKYFGLVTTKAGLVVAVGGETMMGGTFSAERFDPKTGKWTALPPTANLHNPSPAIALPDGRVLVVGGLDEPELLDAAGTAWTKTSKMNVPRDRTTLTLLDDGSVLAVGGENASDMSPLSSAELFDPKAATWTLVAPMKRARVEHVAVKTTAGLVIIAGGEKTGDIEAYVPAKKDFIPAGFLALPRIALCGAPIGNGALFAGGAVPTSFNTYVTITERWLPSPNGEPCSVDAECAGGTCAAGTCGGSALPASDGGFDGAISAQSIVGASFQHCAKNAECASGHCVDGVCCDSACTEKCHHCALPSSPGKCTPEPVGVDLRGECGAALSCTGTCGPTQTCIGSGPGAQCARSRCTSPSGGVGPAVCVAAGAACPTEQATRFDCGAYACEPAFGACLASCGSSADCAGGFLCDVSSKTCVVPAPPPAASGCGYAGAKSEGWWVVLLGLSVLGRRSSVKKPLRASGFGLQG